MQRASWKILIDCDMSVEVIIVQMSDFVFMRRFPKPQQSRIAFPGLRYIPVTEPRNADPKPERWLFTSHNAAFRVGHFQKSTTCAL